MLCIAHGIIWYTIGCCYVTENALYCPAFVAWTAIICYVHVVHVSQEYIIVHVCTVWVRYNLIKGITTLSGGYCTVDVVYSSQTCITDASTHSTFTQSFEVNTVSMWMYRIQM